MKKQSWSISFYVSLFTHWAFKDRTWTKSGRNSSNFLHLFTIYSNIISSNIKKSGRTILEHVRTIRNNKSGMPLGNHVGEGYRSTGTHGEPAPCSHWLGFIYWFHLYIRRNDRFSGDLLYCYSLYVPNNNWSHPCSLVPHHLQKNPWSMDLFSHVLCWLLVIDCNDAISSLHLQLWHSLVPLCQQTSFVDSLHH